jgi:tetratricopeptide (TPR) repeat protein
LRLCPKVEQAWYNLGVLQRNRGQLPEAENSLREAVRLRPGYTEAWSNLGAVYLTSGRVTEAIDALLEAARLTPGDAAVRFNLGNIYGKTGRFTEAIEAYREAVRLKPDFAAAWNNLGIAYKNSGKIPEAIAAFRQAAQIGPTIPLPGTTSASYQQREDRRSNRSLQKRFGRARQCRLLVPARLAYSSLGRRQEALERRILQSLDAGMAEDPGAESAVDSESPWHRKWTRPPKIVPFLREMYYQNRQKERALADFQKACDLVDTSGCDALKDLSREIARPGLHASS